MSEAPSTSTDVVVPSTGQDLAPVPPSGGSVETWPGTLDALEADVARLERAMTTGQHSVHYLSEDPAAALWAPPVGLGPLPRELMERAAELLQRQLAAAETLVSQITQSKRQRDVAARMTQAPDRRAAAFVDQTL